MKKTLKLLIAYSIVQSLTSTAPIYAQSANLSSDSDDEDTAHILKNNDAVKLLDSGKFDPAIAKLTEILKKKPSDNLAKENLATAYNNRGLTEAQQKKVAAARADLQKAYEVYPSILALQNLETLYRLSHDSTTLNVLITRLTTPPLVSKFGNSSDLIGLYELVAVDCQSAKKAKEAEGIADLGLAISPSNTPANRASRARMRETAILAQIAQKKFDKAIDTAQANLAEAEKYYGPDSLPTAQSLNFLAHAYNQVDSRRSESEAIYKRAIKIAESDEKATFLRLLWLTNLAGTQAKLGKLPESAQNFDKVLSALESKSNLTPGEVNTMLVRLTRDRANFDHEGAIKTANAAENFAAKNFGPETLQMADALYAKGDAYKEQKDFVQAADCYKKVLDLRQHLLKPNDPKIANIIEDYAGVLRAQGHVKEATELEEKRKASHPGAG